jgi:hypothetical protein
MPRQVAGSAAYSRLRPWRKAGLYSARPIFPGERARQGLGASILQIPQGPALYFDKRNYAESINPRKSLLLSIPGLVVPTHKRGIRAVKSLFFLRLLYNTRLSRFRLLRIGRQEK